MGSLSIWHWLIVIVVLLLLFGSGKVSHLMGDFAKGIKSFKKNMAEDDDAKMADGTPQGSLSAPGPETTVPKRETTSVHSQG